MALKQQQRNWDARLVLLKMSCEALDKALSLGHDGITMNDVIGLDDTCDNLPEPSNIG